MRASMQLWILGLVLLMLGIGACSGAKDTPAKGKAKENTGAARTVSLDGAWRIDIPRLVDDMAAKDGRIRSLSPEKRAAMTRAMKRKLQGLAIFEQDRLTITFIQGGRVTLDVIRWKIKRRGDLTWILQTWERGKPRPDATLEWTGNDQIKLTIEEDEQPGTFAVYHLTRAARADGLQFFRKAQATQMLRNLHQALSEYESDYGVYPGYDRALSSTDSSPLVRYLDGDPSNDGPKKLYLDFREGDIKDGKLIDLWGNEYRYRVIVGNSSIKKTPTAPDKQYTDGCPDPNKSKYWNIHSFDLWSTGGDPKKICGYITNF